MGKITDALKKVMLEREGLSSQEENKAVFEKVAEKKDIKPKGNAFEKMAKVVSSIDATDIDSRIVSFYDYSNPVSEQYRALRTNLRSRLKKLKSAGKINNIKQISSPDIITVTSALHSEGKSVTSVNLAVTLARDLESKVLLIDCDLRKGTSHKLLNVHPVAGLSDVLENDYDYSVALHKTPVKNLFLIPSGKCPDNPSELLGSQRMKTIIEKLKNENLTHVIIDTPPLIPFTDAGVLGSQTNGVLLVVQAFRTNAQLVKQAKDLLGQAYAKLLGFVLTQSDHYVPDFYSYYNYSQYYRYGKPKQQEVKSESSKNQ